MLSTKGAKKLVLKFEFSSMDTDTIYHRQTYSRLANKHSKNPASFEFHSYYGIPELMVFLSL